MKTFLLILISFFSTVLCAQKISGSIINSKGELLPFSSVLIKGTSIGTTANNKAVYSFSVKPGVYKIVCQHIGFTTIEKEVEVKDDVVLDFVLTEQHLMMSELVVKSENENPAYGIIRKAIAKRSYYNNQVNGFECDLYSKDVIKLRHLPEKILGQKMPDEDRKNMRLDSSGKGIIYLSESVSKVHAQQPNKFKLDVLSSRVSGSNSYGFTFPVFINLYQNNVSIFKDAFYSRGYVSPISDGAIRYYKFRMMGNFTENGKTIYSIKVTPRRKYEPLFSGVINIVSEDWRIHSAELLLTKDAQLELIDTLKISQLYVPVSDSIWRIKNQLLFFSLNILNIDAIGNFLSVYSNYEINPVFSKKVFDRVIIKYDTAVDKKQKSYWDTIRPVPLEKEEVEDYKLKDSLFKQETDSMYTSHTLDSLNSAEHTFNPMDVLLQGVDKKHYNKNGGYQWGIEPLLINTQYNTAEGLKLEAGGYYYKNFSKINSTISIQPHLRYGWSNRHTNGWLDFCWVKSNSSSEGISTKNYWFLSGGKKVVQYSSYDPIEPVVNTFSTLWGGNNPLKTYEKAYVGAAFIKKYENSFSILVKSVFEDRIPIYNTTKYTFKRSDSIYITENYPVQRVTASEIFQHKALLASIEINYTPGQKYIQFPRNKLSLGSIYPTICVKYTKGISGVLGSDVDFDKWSVDVFDNKNLGLFGTLKYKFTAGGFMNDRKVFIQDYKHFNISSIFSSAKNPSDFQIVNPYVYSNTSSLCFESHLEHHFNGLLTNKIPLIKKLKWNLVVGSNSLFIDKNINYTEFGIGLENIFKMFRVDFVSGYENQHYTNSSFVISFGGTFGSSFARSNSNNPQRNLINAGF